MKNVFIETFGNQMGRYERKSVRLPLYLTDNREFYDVTICGIDFVLVDIKRMERFNVSSLKKQLATYSREFSLPVVLGFEELTFFQRKTLIENRMAFAAKNGQIFMPFIGLVFGKCCANQTNGEVERFSPATQMLFLLLLYSEDTLLINKSQVAEKLKLTPMSITRAAKQLRQLGIIEEVQKGTEIKIHRILSKQEAYERADEYLISPVQRSAFVSKDDINMPLTRAGEYELSLRSDFGYPSYEEYAIGKTVFGDSDLTEYNPDVDIDTEIVKFQIWKYEPELFACNNSVDPVSLICSFKGENDERIHKCLDEVTKEVCKWKIGI